MKHKANIFGLPLALLLVAAVPSSAQDASELLPEELEAMFNKQITNNEQTRGLSIAPTNPAPEVNTTETAVVAPETVVPETTYIAVDETVAVSVQISFDFDSAVLSNAEKPKLATLCKVMKKMSETVFQVVGHTDSSGSATYNQNLSLLRAQEVKRHLVNNCGVSEDKVVAIGVGETSLLNSDDPKSDENRRVEFQALS